MTFWKKYRSKMKKTINTKVATISQKVIDLSRSSEVRPRVLPHLKLKLRVHRRYPENFMLFSLNSQ